jgi:hypothetical protein
MGTTTAAVISPKTTNFLKGNRFSFIKNITRKRIKGSTVVYLMPIANPQKRAERLNRFFNKYRTPRKIKKALNRSFLTVDSRKTLMGMDNNSNKRIWRFLILNTSPAKSTAAKRKITPMKKWNRRGTMSPANTAGIKEIS